MRMASAKSASEHSLASPSTIITFSMVAANMMSMSASTIWLMLGLMINCPLIRATRTSEIGPLNGTSDTIKAAEAAKPARASG